MYTRALHSEKAVLSRTRSKLNNANCGEIMWSAKTFSPNSIISFLDLAALFRDSKKKPRSTLCPTFESCETHRTISPVYPPSTLLLPETGRFPTFYFTSLGKKRTLHTRQPLPLKITVAGSPCLSLPPALPLAFALSTQ